MAMKENDWILDGIVNPDKNLDDFLISGYNTSNTQLLSKDDYKKNTIVQQAFTENGAFNDVKFNEFLKKIQQIVKRCLLLLQQTSFFILQ